MSLDANSLTTNILVTVIVTVFVILLPWLDRKICGWLGLSLRGGVNAHPRADKLLKIRQGLLTAGVILYLLLFAWLVFTGERATFTLTPELPLALPAVAIVLYFMARQGIMADERLVRSMDRIR